MSKATVESLTTALNELLGFANRNRDRALKAYISAQELAEEGTDDCTIITNVLVQEARYHEARRFYDVVKLRVAEALR